MVELISSLRALLSVGDWLIDGLLLPFSLGDRLNEGFPVGSSPGIGSSPGSSKLGDDVGMLDDVGESEFDGTILRTIEGTALGVSVTAFSDGARLGCLLGF